MDESAASASCNANFCCAGPGRIFQFVHGEEEVGSQGLVTSQNLQGIVSVLLQSMRDEPHIAEQICVALSQLSVGFKDSEASPFSPYFADSIQALLQQVCTPADCACCSCSVEPAAYVSGMRTELLTKAVHFMLYEQAARDGQHLFWRRIKMCLLVVQGERALQMDVQSGSRLQLQAFEAINEVVRSASPDTLPLVSQLIPALLDKLGSTLRMQVNSTEAKEHQSDLQV